MRVNGSLIDRAPAPVLIEAIPARCEPRCRLEVAAEPTRSARARGSRPGAGRPGAIERDRGERGRDQRVVAGERDAEEAPGRLVAARDVDGLQPPQQIAGRPKLRRARALLRPGPPFPFDAGVEHAEIDAP